MDVIALTYYAIVCGVLGLIGPKLGAPITRLGVGAVVGIVAASSLPVVKSFLGG